MSLYLEELEMDAFEKYCERYISQKENNLINFYNNFRDLGFRLNESSEPYKSINQTKINLIKKVKKLIRNENRLNLNDIKNKRIKLSRKDMNETLALGSVFCKKFVEERIFKNMTEYEIKSFWQKYSVFEGDWLELAKRLLSITINKDILSPMEDDNGFRLNINNDNVKTIFYNLFENIVDPLEKYGIIIPNIKNEDLDINHYDINPINWNQNVFIEEKFIRVNIPKYYKNLKNLTFFYD